MINKEELLKNDREFVELYLSLLIDWLVSRKNKLYQDYVTKDFTGEDGRTECLDIITELNKIDNDLKEIYSIGNLDDIYSK